MFEPIKKVGVVVVVPKVDGKIRESFPYSLKIKKVPEGLTKYFKEIEVEAPDIDSFLEHEGLPKNYQAIIQHCDTIIKYENFMVIIDPIKLERLPKKKVTMFTPDHEKVVSLIHFPIVFLDEETPKFKKFKTKKEFIDFIRRLRFASTCISPRGIINGVEEALNYNNLSFNGVSVYYFEADISDITSI